MKIAVQRLGKTVGYDALGKTLRLFEGEEVALGVGFLRDPGANEEEATMFAVVRGRLHVATGDDIDRGLAGLPAGATADGEIEPGEQAYLLEVAGTSVAIGSTEYVGGTYRGGQLDLQVGPVLVSIATNAGSSFYAGGRA